MGDSKVTEAQLDRLFGAARPGWAPPRLTTTAAHAQELEAWACVQVGHSLNDEGQCIYCGAEETS